LQEADAEQAEQNQEDDTTLSQYDDDDWRDDYGWWY
jgi:hypothetical protein